MKALGIYFGHDINKCDELNWEGKINQIKKIIDIFGKEESYHYRKDTNNNNVLAHFLEDIRKK